MVGVMLSGMVAGLSNAALLAFINSRLAGGLADFSEPIWFAGLAVLVLISRYVAHFWLNTFSTKMVRDLRLHISRMIIRAPYPSLQRLGKALLLGHLTEDVSAIAGASELFPVICINFAIVAGCMTYLSWLSWPLAAVLAGIIVFGVGSFQLCKHIPTRSVRRAREEYDRLSLGFDALTQGVRELKLHRRRSEAFVAQSLTASAEAYRRHSLRATAAYLAINQWIQLLYFLTIGLILYGFPVWRGVSAEVISGYVLVFLFMMSPLTILTTSLPAFSRAKVALRKVMQLDESLAGTPAVDLAELGRREFNGLTLRGVTHAFHREKENRQFCLGPIDLAFEPGELVFLVGGNGSGKTTLAMLLLGLYHPEQGAVVWNGNLVDELNRDAYMQNFSAIFADFYLFDALYGLEFNDREALIDDYLDALHLRHKVKIVNGAFSSVDLSQGQRKRLALLAAYLEDRPFYVFDEWAADQDPEFKQVFYTELLPALKARGKTVLAITHDDKYFHLADRCIKLEEGRITAIEYPQAYRRASGSDAALVCEPVTVNHESCR